MCDQQVLSGWQFDNEPLMTAPVIVIRQHLGHLALTLELNPAGPAFNCPGQSRTGHVAASRRELAILRQPGITGHNQDDEDQEFSHVTHPEKQLASTPARNGFLSKEAGRSNLADARSVRRVELRATQCGPKSRTPYEIVLLEQTGTGYPRDRREL